MQYNCFNLKYIKYIKENDLFTSKSCCMDYMHSSHSSSNSTKFLLERGNWSSRTSLSLSIPFAGKTGKSPLPSGILTRNTSTPKILNWASLHARRPN